MVFIYIYLQHFKYIPFVLFLELAHALYQHDAACRVIARLTKEATAAREALASLKPQAGIVPDMPVAPVQPMVVDSKVEEDGVFLEPVYSWDTILTLVSISGEPIGLSDGVIQKLLDKAGVLTSERKKRGKRVPEGLASSDDIRNFHQVSS